MRHLLFNRVLRLSCLALACLSFLIFSKEQVYAQTKKASTTQFNIKRGTNISHWLSQSTRLGAERKAFFTEKDVANIASLGFDHIRLPIDEMQMWNEAGQKEPEAFALLHDALQWCQKYKLKTIVDLHILRSHYFNAAEKPLFTQAAAQERFYQCWRDLSAEMNKYPVNQVAYELMNEPVADNPEDWNKIVEKAIAVIREKELNRVIVVGSNRWQSHDEFDKLRIPTNDKNILLSFHYYLPFLLTHYQASWTKTAKYNGPVHYPGRTVTDEELAALPADIASLVSDYEKSHVKTVYNAQKLQQDFQKPLDFARKHGLKLYCGEWGALNTAPKADRLRWYQDMVTTLEKNNIAWANWDYKGGGFGFTNNQGENHQTEMIKILTGKQL
ncbi:glycoside hydrolase family 5 protein [Adhaeribacter radiodurans]|uniref:Glycoside hydrolase family 5 protein n=1 Tax=Adhaeribacter radiodurans TaxID=2745197 RepID=A0A7L7LAV2_9BACT|nr:glycoside hydrolase family 5 protein [Adhaeribacter radiodurans]QMU29539.1 glycoside hydrolase family 5 protein [Adhaeribacter radiodurans]